MTVLGCITVHRFERRLANGPEGGQKVETTAFFGYTLLHSELHCSTNSIFIFFIFFFRATHMSTSQTLI